MDGAYLFCLIVGGGLTGLSLLGDFFAGDVDLDTDLDADFDGDVGDAADAIKIVSIRSLIYGMLGFGLAGTLLRHLTPVTAVVAFLVSLGTGAVALVAVTWLLRTLKKSETKQSLDDAQFVGARGTVHIPIGLDTPGTISVHIGLQDHVLRALPFDPHANPSAWKNVVIIEMRGPIALVDQLADSLSEEA